MEILMEPLNMIDGRTPEQLKADGDDLWPDGTRYTPPHLSGEARQQFAAHQDQLDAPVAPVGPMKIRMRCPHCGHDAMYYGEAATLRGEARADVFSCRGCGSAYERDEIVQIAEDYLDGLKAVYQATTAALAKTRAANG